MADGLAAEIEAAERAVWSALQTGDGAADAALLDDAFLGAYPDGFSGREAHAGQLAGGPTVADYALSEITVLPLGADHALIAYRADYRRPGAGAAEAMLVSSVWVRRAEGWRNLFSQDTPVTP